MTKRAPNRGPWTSRGGRPPRGRRPHGGGGEARGEEAGSGFGGELSFRSVELAARVLARAGRERPADAVLREELRASTGMTGRDAREVARLVFAWNRWRGWLGEGDPLVLQVREAWGWARRYESEPSAVSDADLRGKAVPAWLDEVMEIRPRWLRVLQAEPTLWLRVKGDGVESLCRRLAGARAGVLPGSVAYAGSADLFKDPGFHAGEFEIQDLSSQAVGWACGALPGQVWWDCCAGEGGKTLHLSELMGNRGLIWASDRAAWRLASLKRRAARAGAFNYRSAEWDGGARLPTRTKFDGVLVDAPCSGTGTWHRNPHARWTVTREDVFELAAVQSGLLRRVAGSVKPGGILVYAVCSLTRVEGEDVARSFEAEAADFEPVEVTIPGGFAGGGNGVRNRLTLRPEECGGNGMFIARWRRR